MAAGAHAASWCPGQGCAWVRPQDEVVLISSRPAGCSTEPAVLAQKLHAERFDLVTGDGVPVDADSAYGVLPPGGALAHGGAASGSHRAWRTVDWREALLPRDPTAPTVLYIHGNRVAWWETKSNAMHVYGQLMRHARSDRPLRFLIWAWRSDEVDGVLRDFREKAARTAPVGKQLAWVLGQLPPESPLGVFGYSYGARVASHALHELGKTYGAAAASRRVRAAYLAAAFESTWFGPGHRNGLSLKPVESLLLTVNRRDPAMRYYHLMYPGRSPMAMGFCGPTSLSREDAPRVRVVDVSGSVGRTHDMCTYITAPGLMRTVTRLITFEDSAGLPALGAVAAASLPAAPASQAGPVAQ